MSAQLIQDNQTDLVPCICGADNFFNEAQELSEEDLYSIISASQLFTSLPLSHCVKLSSFFFTVSFLCPTSA